MAGFGLHLQGVRDCTRSEVDVLVSARLNYPVRGES